MRSLARLSDDEVIERLTPGPRDWAAGTAEMILLFRLGRPDILAATDLGIQKGHHDRRQDWPDCPLPKEVLKRGRNAGLPGRSVASWYLWRATELKVNAQLRGNGRIQNAVGRRSPDFWSHPGPRWTLHLSRRLHELLDRAGPHSPSVTEIFNSAISQRDQRSIERGR